MQQAHLKRRLSIDELAREILLEGAEMLKYDKVDLEPERMKMLKQIKTRWVTNQMEYKRRTGDIYFGDYSRELHKDMKR